MKTLKTIQTVSKIGKVLSKIVFILSLVGGIGCIVGLLCVAVIPDGIKLGGLTIRGIVEKDGTFSTASVMTKAAVGAILCAGEAVLSKIASNYFTHEVAAGTPFTFDGAKELIRLGICTICIPIGTSIVAGIVYSMMILLTKDAANINFDSGFSVGLGIMFIIAGLLCRHGAEVVQTYAPVQAAPVQPAPAPYYTAPVNPNPANPQPINSAPVYSAPTDPASTDPDQASSAQGE